MHELGDHLAKEASRRGPDSTPAWLLERIIPAILAQGRPERAHVLHWLLHERPEYADEKWAEDTEHLQELIKQMSQGDIKPWLNFAYNYLDRVRIFGIDKPQGRQALGKAIVTLLHTLETAVFLFGSMPTPGVPSGEIR